MTPFRQGNQPLSLPFSEQLQADVQQMEAALARYLPEEAGQAYARVIEAARYSLFAGGKRLRPVLLLEVCRMLGGNVEQALPFACALEMIHTYSLIHDDLPCMDNDDWRRGCPTNHKVFGEAVAVLAGDGLLTLAFTIASQPDKGLSPETTLACIQRLGRAAGMQGMVGGQMMDITAEQHTLSVKQLDQLKQLQALKTGCLIRVACEIGCVIARPDDAEALAAVQTYGNTLGLAFQIQDDILDIEGDTAQLGKTVGKDAQQNKVTFPGLLGVEACRELVQSLTDQAIAALSAYEHSTFLTTLARQLMTRQH